MSKPKPAVPPHLFEATDLPPDHLGRRVCRCGLVGRPGDAHHALPDVPEQAEHLRRYEPGADA